MNTSIWSFFREHFRLLAWLFKSRFDLFQDFWIVSDHHDHFAMSCLQQVNCFFMTFSLKWDTIHRQQLITSFQITQSISETTRNDSGNVDRWWLFTSSHDVESQSFFDLWKSNNSWMRMTFWSWKNGDCCLGCCICLDVRWSINVHGFIHSFIYFSDSTEKIGLENL